MTEREAQKVLISMRILYDTREQDTALFRKRLENFRFPSERIHIDYGDYTADAVLPNGQHIVDYVAGANGLTALPKVAVERKSGLTELAGNLTTDRQRFEREFCRAKEHGAKMYLLVEDGYYRNIRLGDYRTKFSEKAFIASVMTLQARYGAVYTSCSPGETAWIIENILYYELRERLMRGDYDEKGGLNGTI